jgi:hypothetical protein
MGCDVVQDDDDISVSFLAGNLSKLSPVTKVE